MFFLLFFFNDTATTEIYTLSLHDALPISNVSAVLHEGGRGSSSGPRRQFARSVLVVAQVAGSLVDRKSTRLNSSHGYISYAVFCLKKKKNMLARLSVV